MKSDIVLNDESIDVIGDIKVKYDENGSESGGVKEEVRLYFSGDEGELVMGGDTKSGKVNVKDSNSAERIYLNGGEGASEEEEDSSSEAEGGVATLENSGGVWRTLNERVENFVERAERTRVLNPTTIERNSEALNERSEIPESVRVYIEGDAGGIGLGGDGMDGDLVVADKEGESVVHISGFLGDILIKGLQKPVGEKLHELEERVRELEEKQ